MYFLRTNIENIILKFAAIPLYLPFEEKSLTNLLLMLKANGTSCNDSWYQVAFTAILRGQRTFELAASGFHIFIIGKGCPTHIQNNLIMNETDADSKVQIFLNFASHFLHNFPKAVKQLEGNDITVFDVHNIIKIGAKTT